MVRIVYLPLDERPCNYVYPRQIAAATDLELVAPPLSLLGAKKRPADTDALAGWLLAQAASTDHFIVSLDMLVYGGIVPSRLHSLTPETCRRRLQTLAECKNKNGKLRIYAFNLIMRAPACSSDDEEPDYYAEYGAQLSRNGWLRDKATRDGLSEAEKAEWEAVLQAVPRPVLEDFEGRRRTNAAVNRMAVELVRDGTVDFLIVPLDDNAKYGYSSSEQRQLLLKIEEDGLTDRIHVYPGADEVGCTLFARTFCEMKGYRPEIFLRHSSTAGPFSIPKYEDRSLGESLKSQVTAAGGWIADSSAEADAVLMVNSPPVGQSDMAETSILYGERNAAYFSETNLREFAQAIRLYADKGKTVALADVATSNGADEPLMKLLSASGLLQRLAAYAGWNTSGNTLGTVIAHAIVESYYRREDGASEGDERRRNSRVFYVSRLLEDWGYQAIIRAEIARGHLEALGAGYFDVAFVHEQVTGLIRDRLRTFMERYLADLRPEKIRLDRVYMPWKRMFEVGLDVSLEGE